MPGFIYQGGMHAGFVRFSRNLPPFCQVGRIQFPYYLWPPGRELVQLRRITCRAVLGSFSAALFLCSASDTSLKNFTITKEICLLSDRFLQVTLKFMMLSSTGGLILALQRALLLLAQMGGIASTFTGPL